MVHRHIYEGVRFLDYLTALDMLHDILKPVSYVEIGCREGRSLALARCQAHPAATVADFRTAVLKIPVLPAIRR